jgi:hypothetical protein
MPSTSSWLDSFEDDSQLEELLDRHVARLEQEESRHASTKAGLVSTEQENQKLLLQVEQLMQETEELKARLAAGQVPPAARPAATNLINEGLDLVQSVLVPILAPAGGSEKVGGGLASLAGPLAGLLGFL